ncbi:MAG: hypothetical protein JNL72_12665 [Flavipsychrobacter sp.]|nr:hypothetical protein [Flavipsychrobacter sp.]
MKKLLFCIGLFIAASNVTYAQSGSAQTGFVATTTEITKGGNVVATYDRKETRMPNGKVEMVMTFKDASGAVVATATIPYQQKGMATSIKTARDNKEQRLVLKGKMDTEMATEIANQLAAGKYL